MFKLSKYFMRNVACELDPETHVEGVNNKTKIQTCSKLWKLRKTHAAAYYVSISYILQSLIEEKSTQLSLNAS